ncbi:cisplatin damage response ATP-dependent DNA ligase [Alteromonas sp. C1M14]|uniref:cisplatin damage response ATP-dependent DNA ligase n=1 Tax=Alteromonas sp. C1M14 TaxID=2841567 RepID=UPI001C08C799|nr:cisplatin damage response ATP-dependent DNA ligase [Alteromonas sp. C1M14]
MEAFSELLEQLYFTRGTKAKATLIEDYLHRTPDPDRGWAVAALAGELRFDFFKRNTIKALMLTRTDPTLFALSYDYVGEMSETVAHLWRPEENKAWTTPLPGLATLVDQFAVAKKQQVPNLLAQWLDVMTPAQRWALIKLGTRGLRVGISARSMKHILANYGGVSINDIEALWHGIAPPYSTLFSWLDGTGPKPDIANQVTFHPVMLAHPLDEQTRQKLVIKDWQVEAKFDGIRVQLVSKPSGKALFSRTGDDISHAFSDLLDTIDHHCILDGELLVMHGAKIDTFNQLQKRLNKKRPSSSLMASLPAAMMVYDVLQYDNKALSHLPLSQRRSALQSLMAKMANPRLHLSPCYDVTSHEQLALLHHSLCKTPENEGLMLKRKDSHYIPGRPKGIWYKWKRDPLLVDAVIMYAQRGHGKRSSYYSDFTFGAWEGDTLLPIGKAYSGFTDADLKKLDNWVRRHTVGRFGPVKEVQKKLVVEVAFDAVHLSTRHKSGLALRFPRFHRIRWDKPADEADSLDTVKALIPPSSHHGD